MNTSTLNPTVTVVLIDDITIPTDNIAYARPVNDGDTRTPGGYRVVLRSGGHVDLSITADGFASLLAGAAF